MPLKGRLVLSVTTGITKEPYRKSVRLLISGIGTKEIFCMNITRNDENFIRTTVVSPD